MFVKDYSDKPFPSFARTLIIPDIVQETLFFSQNSSIFNKYSTIYVNKDWFIYTRVHNDYYIWGSDFMAFYLKESKYVLGNFEKTIYASSEEDLNKFIEDNPYSEWDYLDI